MLEFIVGAPQAALVPRQPSKSCVGINSDDIIVVQRGCYENELIDFRYFFMIDFLARSSLVYIQFRLNELRWCTLSNAASSVYFDGPSPKATAGQTSGGDGEFMQAKSVSE